MHALLLILDLDETLICAHKAPLDRPHDFRVGPYFIYKRPFLDQFLDFCLSRFRLAVWSSASDNYVQTISSTLFPKEDDLLFVWSEHRITYVRSLPHHYEKYCSDLGYYHDQKRLKKVSKAFRWPMNRILIVDDSPEKSAQNYGNVIHPKPYYGDKQDDDLPKLASYLETLMDTPNLRAVEKRDWHQKVRPKEW